MSQHDFLKSSPQRAMLVRLRRRLGLSSLSVLTMASGPCGGCHKEEAFEHCSSLEDLMLRRDEVFAQSQQFQSGDSCMPSIEQSLGGGGSAQGGAAFAGAPCEMAGATGSDPTGFTPETRLHLQELALAWQDVDVCPQPESYNALQLLTNSEYRAIDENVDYAIASESGQCCYESEVFQNCSGGRPFLVNGDQRLSGLTLGTDRLLDRADTELAAALRGAWAQDALVEHASIAAFARLALQLMHLGAPMNLVVDAQRASLDEARHARLCLSQANSYGGREVKLGALDVSGALDDLSVRELFVTNLVEGCIGETLAAARASAQAKYAESPELRAELEALAADEEHHAALAWSIFGWLLSREDGVNLACLATEVVLARRPHRAPKPQAKEMDAKWRRAGRLPPAEALEVDYQTWNLTVSPLLDELLANVGAPASVESHQLV